MHPGDAVEAGGEPPLNREAARAAARWLMRLQSGQASAADVRACDCWRARSAENERAWQRAQAISRALGLIPPALGMATLGRPAAKGRRATLKTLVALMMAPAAWGAWQAAPASWRADHRSAAGQRRDLRLADGSRLMLNTATAVDVDFSATAHAVWLREGEIYVEAAGPDLPLQVLTRLGGVSAHAARFALRLQAHRCQVEVTTGQVELRPARADARPVSLRAGQQAEFDASTVYPWRSADPRGPAWLRGLLHADAMRLDAFAAELDRYRPGVVRCDPAVAALRISGTFQLANTDGVLQALPALLPVRVRYVTPYWVTLGPADEA